MAKEEAAAISRSSFLPLLLIALAIILIIWVLRPALNSFKANAFKAAIKKQELKDLNARIEDLDSLKNEFRQASRDIEVVTQALPDKPNLPEVISMIEGIAAKSGVSLANLQPGEESGGGEAIVQVTLSGSFEQVNNFLSNLEKNIRPLNVRSITISGSSQDTSSTLSVTAKIGAVFVGNGVEQATQTTGQEEQP